MGQLLSTINTQNTGLLLLFDDLIWVNLTVRVEACNAA